MSETRRSSGVPTAVWAAGAAIAIVLFMFWISTAAQPAETVAVVEDDEPAEVVDPTEGDAAVITLDSLAANTDGYRGRRVRLNNIQVSAPMGSQAFWVDLPNQQPFLIKMGDALIEQGQSVTVGNAVTVVGTVYERTDSVVEAWKASGAIQNEGQEAEALFATSFLEASRVTPAQSR